MKLKLPLRIDAKTVPLVDGACEFEFFMQRMQQHRCHRIFIQFSCNSRGSNFHGKNHRTAFAARRMRFRRGVLEDVRNIGPYY